MSNDILPADFHSWYSGKRFTTDWFSDRAASWVAVMSPLRDRPLRVLELGSWEGRSTLFFLHYLPRATLTCVDTFAGSQEQKAERAGDLPQLGARFRENTAGFESRIRLMISRTGAALDQLADEDARFDIIYIDGSHRRDDVMSDSVMSWRLLDVGGLLIWDDVKFRGNLPSAERPADAIRAMERLYGGAFERLHRDKQLIVRKTADFPTFARSTGWRERAVRGIGRLLGV